MNTQNQNHTHHWTIKLRRSTIWKSIELSGWLAMKQRANKITGWVKDNRVSGPVGWYLLKINRVSPTDPMNLTNAPTLCCRRHFNANYSVFTPANSGVHVCVSLFTVHLIRDMMGVIKCDQNERILVEQKKVRDTWKECEMRCKYSPLLELCFTK